MINDKIICKCEGSSPWLSLCTSLKKESDSVSILHCLRQDQQISKVFIKHRLGKKKKEEIVLT